VDLIDFAINVLSHRDNKKSNWNEIKTTVISVVENSTEYIHKLKEKYKDD
jgi:hypothetical protein